MKKLSPGKTFCKRSKIENESLGRIGGQEEKMRIQVNNRLIANSRPHDTAPDLVKFIPLGKLNAHVDN